MAFRRFRRGGAHDMGGNELLLFFDVALLRFVILFVLFFIERVLNQEVLVIAFVAGDRSIF